MAKGRIDAEGTVADDKMRGPEMGDGGQQGERLPAADLRRSDDAVVQTIVQGPAELVGHRKTDRLAERAAGLKKYDEDRKRLEAEEQRKRTEFERRKREREAARRACDEQLASLQAGVEDAMVLDDQAKGVGDEAAGNAEHIVRLGRVVLVACEKAAGKQDLVSSTSEEQEGGGDLIQDGKEGASGSMAKRQHVEGDKAADQKGICEGALEERVEGSPIAKALRNEDIKVLESEIKGVKIKKPQDQLAAEVDSLEQTVGGRKRFLGQHNQVWDRNLTVAIGWKVYFPDVDLAAYGMNPLRFKLWENDLLFTVDMPTGVWSTINELHLDKPENFVIVREETAERMNEGDSYKTALCAGVARTALLKDVGGVTGDEGHSVLEHAVGLAATMSVMWDASTQKESTNWQTNATTAALATHLDRKIAARAAEVASVAVESLRAVNGRVLDKESWFPVLAGALLDKLPPDSRVEATKTMTRVVAKGITYWCQCSMAAKGLQAWHGVSIGIIMAKRGARENTSAVCAEKA
ncbi:unnamed protein product [Closterium sp. Naga37s-1]|nr:unnamed protein product [Closterium sp. Naga37s-1]